MAFARQTDQRNARESDEGEEMDENASDPARRVDEPSTEGGDEREASDLPYDPEMTEPDEGNVPDTRETGGRTTENR
jgi:hypothetical protein